MVPGRASGACGDSSRRATDHEAVCGGWILVQEAPQMTCIAEIRRLAPLDLDWPVASVAVDHPVDLRAIRIAPESYSHGGPRHTRLAHQLQPHPLLEELSPSHGQNAPPFARGQSPDTHVKQQVLAGSGEFSAR